MRLFVIVMSIAGILSAQTAQAQSDEVRAVLPWTDETGTGLGLGYSHGSWGNQWAQCVQLKLPITRHWGLVAKGLFMSKYQESDSEVATFGGRLGFYGQSQVFLNLFRLYGGGGVQFLKEASGGEEHKWGGGGHFGFEFFMMNWMSFYIEIGGQSGAPGVINDSYATIMAGVQFYPL
jgi:hypothetical protein